MAGGAWCPDLDRGLSPVSVLAPMLSNYVPYDTVRAAVRQAACEMGRELLILDRTAAPPGEGLQEEQHTDLSKLIYSKKDTRPVLSHVAIALLSKFGAPVGGGGVVRLVRG